MESGKKKTREASKSNKKARLNAGPGVGGTEEQVVLLAVLYYNPS